MSASAIAVPVKDNPLFEERNLIPVFLKDVALAGLVGEEDNAATVLLCAASATLPEPLNLSVGGASSAGKNYLLQKGTAPIPPENKKFLSGMTAKTLMHAEEDEYKHKAVIIAEYEGVAKADFAIRTFQSEKQIQWDYVESGKNGIKKKNKIVNGPAAFLQATTRPVLHPENETRLLWIAPDESPEQTERIIRRQAEMAVSGVEVDEQAIFNNWHDFFRSLETMQVAIPYAGKIGESFPVERIRTRRDFPKLLSLIRTSAHLHQKCRAVEDGKIIASPDDYILAKRLFENSYETGPAFREAGRSTLDTYDMCGRKYAHSDEVSTTPENPRG